MILVLVGPRLDAGVERRRRQKVTFEWGPGSLFAIPLNAYHQHFNGSGHAVRRGSSRSTNAAADHQPVRRRRLRLQHPRTTSRTGSTASPTTSPTRTSSEGLLLKTNFVADAVNLPLIEAKERGAGGGHIRFVDGQGLDEQPHLAVPDRDVQEGAPARPRRPRHHPVRRGLQPDVAGGRGAAALRLEARLADRAAEHVVPPALQHRHRRRPATWRSSTRWSRSATRRVCRRRGSASASAATRSTTPTSRPSCARRSRRRWPRTASSRRWTRPTRPSSPDLPPMPG